MFAASPRRSSAKNEQLSASDALPLVIVVDDDAELRETLTDLFRSVGIETAVFACASELLGAGIPDRPCCLVLDLRLPGSSGLDLQARLAQLGVSIPIIFITGHADVLTSVRAMKAGAVDFLSKPFRHQELLDAVNAAFLAGAVLRAASHQMLELRRLADQLTPRELEVLRGVGRGLLNKQVAHEMGISEITVKMHRSSAGRKLKVKSIADMVHKIGLLKL